MSMNLVMVVQNWLGSPGPADQRRKRDLSRIKQQKKETKDHLIFQYCAEFQIRLFSSKAVGSQCFSCGRATAQSAKPFAST